MAKKTPQASVPPVGFYLGLKEDVTKQLAKIRTSYDRTYDHLLKRNKQVQNALNKTAVQMGKIAKSPAVAGFGMRGGGGGGARAGGATTAPGGGFVRKQSSMSHRMPQNAATIGQYKRPHSVLSEITNKSLYRQVVAGASEHLKSALGSQNPNRPAAMMHAIKKFYKDMTDDQKRQFAYLDKKGIDSIIKRNSLQWSWNRKTRQDYANFRKRLATELSAQRQRGLDGVPGLTVHDPDALQALANRQRTPFNRAMRRGAVGAATGAAYGAVRTAQNDIGKAVAYSPADLARVQGISRWNAAREVIGFSDAKSSYSTMLSNDEAAQTQMALRRAGRREGAGSALSLTDAVQQAGVARRSGLGGDVEGLIQLLSNRRVGGAGAGVVGNMLSTNIGLTRNHSIDPEEVVDVQKELVTGIRALGKVNTEMTGLMKKGTFQYAAMKDSMLNTSPISAGVNASFGEIFKQANMTGMRPEQVEEKLRSGQVLDVLDRNRQLANAKNLYRGATSTAGRMSATQLAKQAGGSLFSGMSENDIGTFLRTGSLSKEAAAISGEKYDSLSKMGADSAKQDNYFERQARNFKWLFDPIYRALDVSGTGGIVGSAVSGFTGGLVANSAMRAFGIGGAGAASGTMGSMATGWTVGAGGAGGATLSAGGAPGGVAAAAGGAGIAAMAGTVAAVIGTAVVGLAAGQMLHGYLFEKRGTFDQTAKSSDLLIGNTQDPVRRETYKLNALRDSIDRENDARAEGFWAQIYRWHDYTKDLTQDQKNALAEQQGKVNAAKRYVQEQPLPSQSTAAAINHALAGGGG